MRKIVSILILLFIVSLQLQGFVYSEEGGRMEKKAVMIIAQNNFRDEELLHPKNILENSGITVKIASRNIEEASGMLGARVIPDMRLQDINVQDFDAVIFVGGRGASVYWNDPVAHKIANEAYLASKVVAAICIAPVTLANAGLLKGKKATVWPSEARALTSKGAFYTGKPVEMDGLIITASGPAAADEFGKRIAEVLTSER